MKNRKIKSLVLAVITTASMSACAKENKEDVITLKKVSVMDTTKVTTLVITKVKTPWYAWKGIIVSKMRKTIPEYAAIKGLNKKWYSIAEDNSSFGGLYFWETETDAQRWFTKDWFDATLKKYGEKGKAIYYKVTAKKVVAVPEKMEGKFCAVLLYASTNNYDWNDKSNGLLETYFLKDENNQDCFLTLWQSKEAATRYIANKQMTVEFFETPILLNN